MTITKTFISTFEGITWIEGTHYRLKDGFGAMEVIRIPQGVETRLDRKGIRVPKNPITIRYGHTMGEPA
tara:strand:+ start:2688 stop:2894 length:207 start_codon:yes stop_codon:yes gene_type:complete